MTDAKPCTCKPRYEDRREIGWDRNRECPIHGDDVLAAATREEPTRDLDEAGTGWAFCERCAGLWLGLRAAILVHDCHGIPAGPEWSGTFQPAPVVRLELRTRWASAVHHV